MLLLWMWVAVFSSSADGTENEDTVAAQLKNTILRQAFEDNLALDMYVSH